MLRLSLFACAGLLLIPIAGMSQELQPPADEAKPGVEAKPDDSSKPTEVTPAPPGGGAPAGSKPVVVAEGKILIRPWNYEPDHEWEYTLSNGRPSVGTASGPVAGPHGPGEVGGPLVPRMTYDDAYNAITFRRSQYDANPSYRHDAAMELMFGALRPTTIVRNSTQTVGTRYPYPTHKDYRRRHTGSSWWNPYYYHYPLYSRSLYAY